MSIQTRKRKKLFKALKKGYGETPECCSMDTLIDKMNEEMKEVQDLLPIIERMYYNPQLTDETETYYNFLDELADLSNMCDFLYDNILINKLYKFTWAEIYNNVDDNRDDYKE